MLTFAYFMVAADDPALFPFSRYATECVWLLCLFFFGLARDVLFFLSCMSSTLTELRWYKRIQPMLMRDVRPKQSDHDAANPTDLSHSRMSWWRRRPCIVSVLQVRDRYAFGFFVFISPGTRHALPFVFYGCHADRAVLTQASPANADEFVCV